MSDFPYAGTSGWSGTDTSRQRALTEDADGTTSARATQAVRYLSAAGRLGATWSELAEYYGWHHGQASATLSRMHKGGRIARLTQSRGKQKVYVMPEFVEGRPTEDHKPRLKVSECPHCGGEL